MTVHQASVLLPPRYARLVDGATTRWGLLMDVRYHIDPDTDLPHIYGHGVTEDEAEYVLRHPGEDRSGRDGSRHALGQTASEIGRAHV